MPVSIRSVPGKLLALALSAGVAGPAFAQDLAGAPQYGGPQYGGPQYGAPQYGAPQYGAGPYTPGGEDARMAQAGEPQAFGGEPHNLGPHGRRASHRGGERECYAQVRTAAAYAPPPTGPEYVWRQAPAPPGAPGPVWCLTVQPFPAQAIQVAPARLGWIRVLCADDATPERVSRLQRGLHARGLYRGEIDGRYDARTADAVLAFQHARHIAHRGYLSYQTLAALEGPPPPVYWSAPTTFERGYLDWPGKSRYW